MAPSATPEWCGDLTFWSHVPRGLKPKSATAVHTAAIVQVHSPVRGRAKLAISRAKPRTVETATTWHRGSNRRGDAARTVGLRIWDRGKSTWECAATAIERCGSLCRWQRLLWERKETRRIASLHNKKNSVTTSSVNSTTFILLLVDCGRIHWRLQ